VIRVIALLACVAVIAAGCAAEQVPPRPNVTVPTQWLGKPTSGDEGTRDLGRWWAGFDDAELDRLVGDAIVANRDVAVARARVRESLAGVTAHESALFPRVDLTAAAGRSKDLTRTLPIVDNRFATFVSSWELDLFGGRRAEVDAARARTQGADAGVRAAQVAVVSEVARNYFELRGAQARRALAIRNVEVQRETLRLVAGRFRAGLASDLDVARATAQLEGTEGAVPDLEAEIAARSHRLSALVGAPPRAIELRAASGGVCPASRPRLPELVPNELLEQRPDLARARDEVAARAAELGAAKSELFPRFFLSAGGGYQRAQSFPLPYRASDVFSLGALLTAPIFNAGRIRAGIEAADARLGEAAASYEKALLEALEDVENAYALHASALARDAHLKESFAAAERARLRAEAYFQKGTVDYLALLDAQRTALSAEDALVRVDTGVCTSIVGLYRAFGGGWERWA
jgi:NodT family efflux transporter outer membrane factor (OMF) lipoprotein